MECYVCLGGAPPPVLQPCACRGTTGVHLNCLEESLLAGGVDKFLTCALNCPTCQTGFTAEVSLHLAQVAKREVDKASSSSTETVADSLQDLVRKSAAKRNLAVALSTANRSVEAAELSGQVFNEQINLLGLHREDPPVIEAAHNYALNLSQLGRFREAEALLRENVEICQLRGEIPWDKVIALAWARTEMGTRPMLKQAEQLLVQLLKNCNEYPASALVDKIRRNASSCLAANLAQQGRHAEGAMLWREAMENSRRTFGDQSSLVKEQMEQLRIAETNAARAWHRMLWTRVGHVFLSAVLIAGAAREFQHIFRSIQNLGNPI